MTFDLPYTFWRMGRLDSAPDRDQWIAISAHQTLTYAKAAGGRLSRGHPRPEKLRVTCRAADGGVDEWTADYNPGCGLSWTKTPTTKVDNAQAQECNA